MEPIVTRYSADSRSRNLRQVFHEMISGLVRARYMAYRLTLKDIRNEYASSAFGMLWDFLDPFVLGLIFYFLMRSAVFEPGAIPIPYAVFVVYGILLYQTFTDALLQSVHLIQRSKGLLNQLKLPPEALILSVFYRVMFMSSFRIAVMLIFSIAAGALHPLGLLLFLLAFPLFILSAMAPGIFLAPFNAIYKDVGRLAQVILLPLRYVSLVFFLFPAEWIMDLVYRFNVIALLLSNMRLLATTGTIIYPLEAAIHLTLLAAFGLIGWFIFHVSIPILAERA